MEPSSFSRMDDYFANVAGRTVCETDIVRGPFGRSPTTGLLCEYLHCIMKQSTAPTCHVGSSDRAMLGTM
jgi:hypothetical protein